MVKKGTILSLFLNSIFRGIVFNKYVRLNSTLVSGNFNYLLKTYSKRHTAMVSCMQEVHLSIPYMLFFSVKYPVNIILLSSFTQVKLPGYYPGIGIVSSPKTTSGVEGPSRVSLRFYCRQNLSPLDALSSAVIHNLFIVHAFRLPRSFQPVPIKVEPQPNTNREKMDFDTLLKCFGPFIRKGGNTFKIKTIHSFLTSDRSLKARLLIAGISGLAQSLLYPEVNQEMNG